MNVLLACAGRRNYLVDYFKQALNGKGKVFAADMSPNAPALQDADQGFVVPDVYDPDYIGNLLALCKKQQAQLVIPLNDLELPILAEHKERFRQEGIIIVVADAQVIDTCFDKWKTFSFASQNGIPVPKIYLTLAEAKIALTRKELLYPVMVKPRWGTASIGTEICHDEAELVNAYELTRRRLPRTFLSRSCASDSERSVLIQEMLHGVEYGLDVVNDLAGHYAGVLIKRKLAMRAGETDKAVTVDNHDLAVIGEKIGQCLGHIGNLDCDIFGTDKGYFLLEMNPRFGGGYPFSHVAGANIPAALLAWADGQSADPAWLKIKPDITSAKCDRLVLVNR